jgi:N-acetylglutamate synthase-like GNAT family acetyltransferase
MLHRSHRRGEFVVTTDPTRLDHDFIHGYLVRSYWSEGIPREVVERALSNSRCFGVYEGEKQVGFARVISDFATFAYLADVFILESHRARGLSKFLMECILQDPELQGLRRWTLATRDAHGLYERFGFKPLANPDRFMEIHNPDVYKKSAGSP